MSDAANLPKEQHFADPKSMSARLQAHYGCRFSVDLEDWFDSGIWKLAGGYEYTVAATPESLLASAPEHIWPGLMPCDLLPLISNGEGDWLAVRVDTNNHASEIVQWYHGGGDWIPWGRTLAEAILFDDVNVRLPGPHRRHAIPAEPIQRMGSNAWTDWATSHLPRPAGDLLSDSISGAELADALLEHQLCEVAVRCELVQDCLSESLSQVLSTAVANELGVDWNTAVEWMFDGSRIPATALQRLQTSYGYESEDQQDWATAAQHAKWVTIDAPRCTWAWDILGYACEKAGDRSGAIRSYSSGALQSSFADQSVRLRTHWVASRNAKFSAARLIELGESNAADPEYLQCLANGNAEKRRELVTQYWLAKANGDAEPTKSVEHYIAAGWDLGAEPISSYGEIVEQIVNSANGANQTARAQVAQTHRECLRDRYGI